MREEDTLELIKLPTQVQGLRSGVSLDTVEVCPMYRFWEMWSPLKLWSCYPTGGPVTPGTGSGRVSPCRLWTVNPDAGSGWGSHRKLEM